VVPHQKSEAIVAEHLSRRFAATVAVDDISFTAHEGEFFGFLGPNGAGKTTTISMLCTLLPPTGGSAWVNGYDIATQADEVRRSIGLVFQDPTLDDRLTAAENLEFHARIYHVPRAEWVPRREQLLRMVDLWDRRDHLVRTFSGGMRRRLEVARGLLHHPRVLFLDEPTLGLDPQTRETIWSYLLRLREQERLTLFLTTHYMEETERCNRIAIIDHGKIIALDSPSGLKARVGGDVIRLEVDDPALARANLRDTFGIDATEVDGGLRLEVRDGAHLIPRLVGEIGVPVRAVTLRAPTLDDVFLSLTGAAIREHEGDALEGMREHVRSMRR